MAEEIRVVNDVAIINEIIDFRNLSIKLTEQTEKNAEDRLKRFGEFLGKNFGAIAELQKETCISLNQINGSIIQKTDEVKNRVEHLIGTTEEVKNRIGVLIIATEEVRKEVARGTEASAFTLVLQTAGKIFSQLGLIRSQEKRLSEQYYKVINRISRINQKFNRLNSEIEVSYKTDVKRIGKYILEIWENFQKAIEPRLKSFHFVVYDITKNSIEKLRNFRQIQLKESRDTMSSKLDSFLNQRKTFHETLSKVKIENSKIKNEIYSIPVTIAISKNETNSQRVYVGTEIQDKMEGSVKFRFEDMDWFQTYRNFNVNYEASINWKDMNENEKAELISCFEELQKDGLYDLEFTDAIKDALLLNPPRVPESVGILAKK